MPIYEDKDVERVQTDAESSAEAVLREKMLGLVVDPSVNKDHGISFKHEGYDAAPAENKAEYMSHIAAKGSATNHRRVTVDGQADPNAPAIRGASLTPTGEIIVTPPGANGGGEANVTSTVSGGKLTIEAGNAVRISAWVGRTVDAVTDSSFPQVVEVEKAEEVFPITFDPNYTGGIFILREANGSTYQSYTLLSREERRTKFALALVNFEDGVMTRVFDIRTMWNSQGLVFNDYLDWLSLEDTTKGMLVVKQSAATLTIKTTAGTLFQRSINEVNNPNDPNVLAVAAIGDETTPAVFDVVDVFGNVIESGATVIPKKWDNVTRDVNGAPVSNTIETLSGQKAAIAYVFLKSDTDEVIVQLGQNEYADTDEAVLSLNSDALSQTPATLVRYAVQRAQIWISAGASNFEDPALAGIRNVGEGSGFGGGGEEIDLSTLTLARFEEHIDLKLAEGYTTICNNSHSSPKPTSSTCDLRHKTTGDVTFIGAPLIARQTETWTIGAKNAHAKSIFFNSGVGLDYDLTVKAGDAEITGTKPTMKVSSIIRIGGSGFVEDTGKANGTLTLDRVALIYEYKSPNIDIVLLNGATATQAEWKNPVFMDAKGGDGYLQASDGSRKLRATGIKANTDGSVTANNYTPDKVINETDLVPKGFGITRDYLDIENPDGALLPNYYVLLHEIEAFDARLNEGKRGSIFARSVPGFGTDDSRAFSYWLDADAATPTESMRVVFFDDNKPSSGFGLSKVSAAVVTYDGAQYMALRYQSAEALTLRRYNSGGAALDGRAIHETDPLLTLDKWFDPELYVVATKADIPAPSGAEMVESYTVGRYIEVSPGNTYYVGISESSDGTGSIYGSLVTFGSFDSVKLNVKYASNNQATATVTLEYSDNGSTWSAAGASFTVDRYNTDATKRLGVSVVRTVASSPSRQWRVKVGVSNTPTGDTVSGQLLFYNA